MCNKTLVMNRIDECFAMAEQRYNQTFRKPNVRFDKRGTTAGTANYVKWELNFNMVLLNENVEHFVHQTVAHEVAHLVDHQVNGSLTRRFDSRGRRVKRQPHGPNWKRVMIALGVSPDRCHEMDTTNARVTRRKTETFDYHCSGCNKTLPMGKIRHNKQQSGKASYSHCRGHKLTFVG